MTIRLLIANGCSFTWGDELDDRARAWPHVVGRALGAEVVNLGVCGGSNRRLVRTTVETLHRVVTDHRLMSTEVLFLGMWTSLERYEFFDPDTPDPVGRADLLPGDEHWRRVLPWAARRRERLARTYYREIHDDRGALNTFLVDWVLLQSFLSHGGYHFGFLASRPLFRDAPPPPAHLTDLIDPRYVHGGLTGLDGHSMSTMTAHSHAYGPRRHPLTAAHEHFAGAIMPWLRSLQISNATHAETRSRPDLDAIR
ncbi:DUF6071 family protein [Actinosynnema sp. NPDC050436]|uniref:DUF6071 family protein n=1 Tax=Actinosynnema sp. NPDC050436 TaxID=3155659 RepID=UPI0033C97D08